MTNSEKIIQNQEGLHQIGQITLDGKPYPVMLDTYVERKASEVFEKYQTGVPALTDLSILQHVGDAAPYLATGHLEFAPKTLLDANNCLLTGTGIQSIKVSKSETTGNYIGLQSDAVVGSACRSFVYNGREFVKTGTAWSDGTKSYTFGLSEDLVIFNYPYLYFLIGGKVYVDLSLVKSSLALKVVGGKLCLNTGAFPIGELPLQVYGAELYKINGLGYLTVQQDYMLQPEFGKLALLEHSAGISGQTYTISYLYQDTEWDTQEFSLDTTKQLDDTQLRSLTLYRKTGGYGTEVLVSGKDYLIDPNSYKIRLVPSGRHQPATYTLTYLMSTVVSKIFTIGPSIPESFGLNTKNIKAILVKDANITTQQLKGGQDYLIEPTTGRIRFVIDSMATMGKPYSVTYLYGSDAYAEWSGAYAIEIDLGHDNVGRVTVGRIAPSSIAVGSGISIDPESRSFRLNSDAYNALGTTFDLNYIKETETVDSLEVTVGTSTVLKDPSIGRIVSKNLDIRWKNPLTLIPLRSGVDYNFDSHQGAFYFNSTHSLQIGDTVRFTGVKNYTLSGYTYVPAADFSFIQLGYPILDIVVYGKAPAVRYAASEVEYGQIIARDYFIDHIGGRIFIPYGSRIRSGNVTIVYKYYQTKTLTGGGSPLSKAAGVSYSFPVVVGQNEEFLSCTVKGLVNTAWVTDSNAVLVKDITSSTIQGSLPSATQVTCEYSVLYSPTQVTQIIVVSYNVWIPLTFANLVRDSVAITALTSGVGGRGFELTRNSDYHINLERGLLTFPTVFTRRDGCPDGLDIQYYYLYGYKVTEDYVIADAYYRPFTAGFEPDYANMVHVQVDKIVSANLPGEPIQNALYQYNSVTQSITVNSTSSIYGNLLIGDKVTVYFNYVVPSTETTTVTKTDTWISMEDVEGADYLSVNMGTLFIDQSDAFFPYRENIDYLVDRLNGIIYPIAGSDLATGTGNVLIKFLYSNFTSNTEIITASESWTSLAYSNLLSGGEIVEYPASGILLNTYRASESYFKDGMDYLLDVASSTVQVLKSGRIIPTTQLAIKIFYGDDSIESQSLALTYNWLAIFGATDNKQFLVGSEIVDANPTRYELMIEGADYRAILDTGQLERITSGAIYATDTLLAKYSKLILSSYSEDKVLTTGYSMLEYTNILPNSIKVAYTPGTGTHPDYSMVCIPDRDYVLEPESGTFRLPQETRLREGDLLTVDYSEVDWEAKMDGTGIAVTDLDDIEVDADKLHLAAGRVLGLKDGLVFEVAGRKVTNLLNYGGSTLLGIGSMGAQIVVYGGISVVSGKTAGFIDSIQGERLLLIDNYKNDSAIVTNVCEGGLPYFIAGTSLCEMVGQNEYRRVYDISLESSTITDLRSINQHIYYSAGSAIKEFNAGTAHADMWVLTGYLDGGYKNVAKVFSTVKLKFSRAIDTSSGEAVRVQCFENYEQLIAGAASWDEALIYDAVVTYDGLEVTGSIPDRIQSEGLYIRVVATGIQSTLKLYYYDVTFLPYGNYHRNWTVTVRCQANTKYRDLRYETRLPYEIMNDLKVLAASQRVISFKDILGLDYNVRVDDLTTSGVPPDAKSGSALVTLALSEVN